MQIIKTDLTYSSIQNAETKLSKALVRVGLSRDEVRYVIAAVQVDDGSTRYAPAVLMPSGGDITFPKVNDLMFQGVTILN